MTILKLLNIEIKVEYFELMKNVMLIKIIFIEMVMVIHLLRLEQEYIENLPLETSFHQDTDRKAPLDLLFLSKICLAQQMVFDQILLSIHMQSQVV